MAETKPVVSSLLSEVGYDEDAEELTVVFKNGKRYVYEAVPPDTYDDLIAAPSLGKFFARNVKSKYDFRKE